MESKRITDVACECVAGVNLNISVVIFARVSFWTLNKRFFT